MSGSLQYSTDNATWTAMGSVTITPSGSGSLSGTYTAQITGGLPVGVWNVYVRNPALTSQAGETPAPFAVTPVSPVALPTIANHLFADEPSAAFGSYFQDVAYSVQAAIGNTVSGLQDQTGSGNNFFGVTGQTITTNPPTFTASVKNGMPALVFDGATDFLRILSTAPMLTSLRTSTGWTISASFTVAALPAGSTTYEVFQTLASGVLRLRLVILNTGIVQAYLDDDTTNRHVSSPTAVTVGATNTVVFGYDGTNLKMTLNTQAEQTLATGTLTLVTAWSDGYIGASRFGSIWNSFFNGSLLALHVWNTAYSTANATALVSYGTSKWGS